MKDGNVSFLSIIAGYEPMMVITKNALIWAPGLAKDLEVNDLPRRNKVDFAIAG
jgi:hypothetical protein